MITQGTGREPQMECAFGAYFQTPRQMFAGVQTRVWRRPPALFVTNQLLASPRQSDGKGIAKGRFAGDVKQVNSQMNNGLGDLRTNPADDAIGAHQTRRGDGFQKML